MMTQKDFEAIAARFRQSRPNPVGPHYDARMEQWSDDRLSIAAALKASNPRFDSERFHDACWSLKP